MAALLGPLMAGKSEPQLVAPKVGQWVEQMADLMASQTAVQKALKSVV
jgi:hypothetical protein